MSTHQVYVKKDFSPNTKCLVLSTFLAGCYGYLVYNPAKQYYGINPLIFILIYLFAYIGLAWYDYLYDCQKYLLQTGVGKDGKKLLINPDSIFKPGAKEQDVYYQRTVYMFHLFMVAPLMMYVGYFGSNAPFALTFTGGMGLLAALYHGYSLAKVL